MAIIYFRSSYIIAINYCLEYDEISITQLSEKADIARSSAKYYLENLVKHNVMRSYYGFSNFTINTKRCKLYKLNKLWYLNIQLNGR